MNSSLSFWSSFRSSLTVSSSRWGKFLLWAAPFSLLSMIGEVLIDEENILLKVVHALVFFVLFPYFQGALISGISATFKQEPLFTYGTAFERAKSKFWDLLSMTFQIATGSLLRSLIVLVPIAGIIATIVMTPEFKSVADIKNITQLLALGGKFVALLIVGFVFIIASLVPLFLYLIRTSFALTLIVVGNSSQIENPLAASKEHVKGHTLELLGIMFLLVFLPTLLSLGLLLLPFGSILGVKQIILEVPSMIGGMIFTAFQVYNCKN